MVISFGTGGEPIIKYIVPFSAKEPGDYGNVGVAQRAD
jgi:hypothetical protein